jgi:protein phosphatase 1L
VQAQDGTNRLLTANVGDSRVLLARSGEALQLTTDHVPDDEGERRRIELTNPNPKMPLVRFVGETWRVGGLLALSRAFGDAYLKGSLQFEGVPAGSDGYASGFGVIAEPDTSVVDLTADDSWVCASRSALWAVYTLHALGGSRRVTMSAVPRACALEPQPLRSDALDAVIDILSRWCPVNSE